MLSPLKKNSALIEEDFMRCLTISNDVNPFAYPVSNAVLARQRIVEDAIASEPEMGLQRVF
jgi:hypothetical protein